MNRLSPFLLLAVCSLGIMKAHAGSAVVMSTNGYYGYAYGSSLTQKAAEQKATELVRQKGGTDIRTVASVGGGGYSSVAVSGKGPGAMIGAALGYRSSAQADYKAQQNCKQKGGSDPHIVRSWSNGSASGSSRWKGSGQGVVKL
ncbi:MAG TPA: DUF4189 domain-containing protein [Chthoniobacterales bacterium]